MTTVCGLKSNKYSRVANGDETVVEIKSKVAHSCLLVTYYIKTVSYELKSQGRFDIPGQNSPGAPDSTELMKN